MTVAVAPTAIPTTAVLLDPTVLSHSPSVDELTATEQELSTLKRCS